jgi:hypothetical protein
MFQQDTRATTPIIARDAKRILVANMTFTSQYRKVNRPTFSADYAVSVTRGAGDDLSKTYSFLPVRLIALSPTG